MRKWKKWLLMFIIIGLIFGLVTIYKQMLPVLDEYGRMQIEQFTSAVLVHYKREIFTSEALTDWIVVNRDESGEILSIEYDMVSLNQLADQLVYDAESTIYQVQLGGYQAKDDSRYEQVLQKISTEQGVVGRVPLETALSFPLLSILRVQIPVRFKTMTNFSGEIITDVSDYSMNDTLVKISVRVTMNQEMVLPFFHEIYPSEYTFPVALRLIKGRVPEVYLGGQTDE